MRNIITLALCLIVGRIYAQVDCSGYDREYIPKNLNDATNFLLCKWSETDKDEFKNKEEDTGVADLHFGTGVYIRNGWKLWEGKNRLSRFFKSKGIFHPDDMSSIILTSFHRRLNDKPIELDQQIAYYKSYWEEINNREKSLKQLYKELEVGDKLKIPFSGTWRYDGTDRTTLTIYHYMVSDKDSFECIVEGKIVGKKRKKRSRWACR
ncbi:MAG: DUF6794 domain-containing protein [Bacteroidota bacterium]